MLLFILERGAIMTIIDAINRIDALKPNVYSQSEKIDWLSAIDGMIKRTVMDFYYPSRPIPEEPEENETEQASEWRPIRCKHEKPKPEPFVPYTEDTPLDTVLLAYAPFDDLYIYWLESKIDYANGEYAKYNNSVSRFNEAFSMFRNDYNRTHEAFNTCTRYF